MFHVNLQQIITTVCEKKISTLRSNLKHNKRTICKCIQDDTPILENSLYQNVARNIFFVYIYKVMHKFHLESNKSQKIYYA